ncbi:MAG: hypothetical protein KAU10_00640, partial [Dehalococcoidia bacterium]|nr:hypothetical protein [Dehalococcoidia bacterium]
GSTTVEFTWPFTPLEEDFNCCHFVLIVDSGGEIEECPPWGEMNNVAGGMVCCEIPTQECPDLTITGSHHSCSCTKTETGYLCEVHVEATVTNIAPEVPVVGSFGVALLYGCIDGGGPLVMPIIGPKLDELNENGSTSVEFSYEFATTDPTPPCCDYNLVVDSFDVIDEACHPYPDGEDNNLLVSTFCCEELPGCPDIVIEITRYSCKCKEVPIYERRCVQPPTGGPCQWQDVLVGYETECKVTVHFMVKNIGTQDAGEFHVKLETSTGHTDTKSFSGLAIDEEKNRWFDFTFEGGTVNVTLIADSGSAPDYVPEVDECNEDNNEATTTLNCE